MKKIFIICTLLIAPYFISKAVINQTAFGAKPSSFTRNLEYIIARNKTDKLKFYLLLGLDVNGSGGRRMTMLHIAAHKGADKSAKFLIENGADVNALDDYRQSPLWVATQKKRYEVAKLLIENGADINFRWDSGGKVNEGTPLLVNAFSGHPEAKKIFLLLLESGVNVNVKDKRGNSMYKRAPFNFMDKMIEYGAKENLD